MAKRKIHKNSLKNLEKGFQSNPQNINTDGANKGSKWRKNILKELATVTLNEVDNKMFESFKKQFPEFFTGSDDYNWQFFMAIKQLSLVMHKDPRVAQAALKEVNDRIEGKAVNRVAPTDSKGDDLKKEPETSEEINKEIERLENELLRRADSRTDKGVKPKTRKTGKKRKGGSAE